MREASAFGSTSAAASEYRASQQAADAAARAAAEQERIASTGSDALDRALEKALQLRDVSAETVGVVNEQQSAWTVVGDTILSAARAGEYLDEVLKNIAISLAEMAMQGAMLGQGPLAGLFGFSGGVRGSDILSQALRGAIGARAMGGPVSANTPYLVGERGPEIIVPRSAGQVIPNHNLGGTTFAPQTSIIVQGSADEGTLALMQRELDARDRRLMRMLPSQVKNINRDPLRS